MSGSYWFRALAVEGRAILYPTVEILNLFLLSHGRAHVLPILQANSNSGKNLIHLLLAEIAEIFLEEKWEMLFASLVAVGDLI